MGYNNNMAMINKAIRVDRIVGLVGWIRGNSHILDKEIAKANREGWEVHQFIRYGGVSLFTRFVRVLLLLVTFGIYSKMTLGTIIYKKERK